MSQSVWNIMSKGTCCLAMDLHYILKTEQKLDEHKMLIS